MDVLDNERDRDSTRSPWLGRFVGGVAAIAVALAVVPTLIDGLTGSGPVQAPTPSPVAAPASASDLATPLTLREPTQTGAHVLLTGRQLSILDVDAGHMHTLFLPSAYGSARPGGVLRVADSTVVLAERPPSAGPGLNSEAFVVQDSGVTLSLGTASQILPATPDAVWLTQANGGGRTIRLVGVDGAERLAARPLPRNLRLVAPGSTSTVLLGTPVEEPRDRIVEWDPVTGEVTRVLAEQGHVHDADEARVLWQECDQCQLQTYDRITAATTAVEPLPDGWQLTGRATLSPDGRHWAAMVATSDEPDRRSVVIGHLPGTQYADSISTHLDLPPIGRVGRPRLSWSQSGWLFVSTGYSLWTVSPGPHQAFGLDAPDHDSIAAW
jgi:hypothetical protein